MEKRNKITLHQLFWYFIFFSIAGLIIETLYCFITTGNIESRKGLIWGAFCPVYGVGAVVLIIFLNKYQDNYWKLFIYGELLGAVTEYILSYILEAIYGIRFWDYSYLSYNLNGRICAAYSIYWGFLAILLMKLIKPVLDKLIAKITGKYQKQIDLGIFLFLCIDALVTVWAIHSFETRIIANYYDEEITLNSLEQSKFFCDEQMLTTFPNLRVVLRNGEQVFIKDIITQK